MLKLLKLIISWFVVAIMLVSFIACDSNTSNGDEDPVVMSYKDKQITASEFGYYLSKYKSQFAKIYADFSDTDEFYGSEINGKNAEEYLFDMVVQNVKRTLISEVIYAEKGQELSDEIVSDIEYYIDMLIYEKFGDDYTAFDNAVNRLGISTNQLRNIYLRDEVTYELLSLMMKNKAEIGITDESMQSYLEENYARICHIYVNNKYTYQTDSNGKLVYDDEGQKITVPMSGKELATKNAVIDAIDESLADGGDFLEIYDAFSEDKLYKNGYYLQRNTQFIDKIVDAAFELEIGEWVKLETNVGTHYVKRIEMDKAPWTNSENDDFLSAFENTVINEFFGFYLDSFADEVVVNEDALSEFYLRTAEINYIF